MQNEDTIVDFSPKITPLNSLSDDNSPEDSPLHPPPSPSEDNISSIRSTNPPYWGPKLWYSIHNAAAAYPNDPSPAWKYRMKQFILGLPVVIPCEKCFASASAYIISIQPKLDEIVSSNENLVVFFWQFHNDVNIKLNKPTLSLSAIKKLYPSS